MTSRSRILSLGLLSLLALAQTSRAEAQWGQAPADYRQYGPAPAQPVPAQQPMGMGVWPSSPNAPQGALNAHFSSVPNWDAVASGAVFFGLGYAASVVLGSIWLGATSGDYLYNIRGTSTYYTTCDDQYGGLSFIPLVGPLIAAGVYSSCGVPIYQESDGAFRLTGYRGTYNTASAWAGAIPATVFQVLGFALIIGGELAQVQAVTFDGISMETGGGRLGLAFSAPGADAGMSLRFVH